LLLTLMLCFPQLHFAQTNNSVQRCASAETLERECAANPARRAKLEQLEQTTARLTAQPATNVRGVAIIPVVVHVLYRTDAENISDAQINSQIAALNRDFRKANSDQNMIPPMFQGLAADCDIQFQLAKRTPDAKATNGIERTHTLRNTWGTGNDVKYKKNTGADAWNSAKYLNIWVCNIGGGILGNSQFPGGDAATDGVVIDYRYFGTVNAVAPFNLGRTTTHEVGHWLNLRHIWGDDDCGDDKVSDTPTQKEANFGGHVYPRYSNCNGARSVDMTMNYMDYTHDDAMCMFTSGQKARIWATLNTERSSILTSDACQPLANSDCIVSGISIQNSTATSVQLTWTAIISNLNFTLEYALKGSTNTTSIQTDKTNLTINNLQPNTAYQYRIRAACGTVSDWQNFNTPNSINITTTNDIYENNDTRLLAKTIATNATIKAVIAMASDRDWFRFETSDEQPNVSVVLNNLPSDYDLRLYNAAGELIADSKNKDTQSEQLFFNASKAGLYFIQVSGYDGAYSSEQYALTITSAKTIFSDKNGNSKNLRIRENLLSVYPNPILSEATIVVEVEKNVLAQIQLINLNGQVAQTMQQMVGKDNATVSMVIDQIPAGLYLLTVTIDDEVQTKKVVVQ
jgi:hypothetical protein